MVLLPQPSTSELPEPAPLALLTAPSGSGKTHAVLQALVKHQSRAVYVTPTHELAIQVQKDLQKLGVRTHYWRRGPDDEDACEHQELVELFRVLGYLIRRGPCQDCFKRKKCAYRKLFTCRANRSAQVLIITSWHLRREDLWKLKAMENRPLIILDEDTISGPVEITVGQLRDFLDNLYTIRQQLSYGEDEDNPTIAWLTRRLTKHASDEQAALGVTDIFRRAAEDILRASATAGHGQWSASDTVIKQWISEHDLSLLARDGAFDTLIRCAYNSARRSITLPNIMASMRELLREPRPIYVSVSACRWPRRCIIPEDRQILMLDATAQPEVVAGIMGRSVEVIDTPAIEQRATIYQVMDKIGTRSGNRRDIEHEQSWTIKLTHEVARKHRNQSLLCVTFKNDEDKLAAVLDSEHDNCTVIHFGALRGLNSFENFQVGLIIGRPMPNQAQLQLLAVSAFGLEALDDKLSSPSLQWQFYTHNIGPDAWTLRRQQYDDPRWRAVWHHVVTGELMQAVGRLRPLTNPATIYIVTNEPLPEQLDITAVYGAELFGSMSSSARRTDFQERIKQYAEALKNLAASGMEPTNRAVCELLGIKECNGFRYRRLAQESLSELQA